MILLNVLPLTGLPVPLLTYEWNGNDPPPDPGTRLLVPLGRREEVGILWETNVSPPPGGVSLKPVLDVLDPFPVLPPDLFGILTFTSWFYRLPLGLVARTALPSLFLQPKPIPKKYRSGTGNVTSTPGATQNQEALPPLTGDQAKAVSIWKEALAEGSFSPWVLQGVTGSGKTRLYQEMSAEILRSGKQVLVLTPEIALVPPLASAFSKITGDLETIHSQLTPSRRLSTWLSILKGSVPLVIGPRSSFFAPLTRLGLIIVDEEQDPAYQAYEGLSFNVRSLSLKRAQMLGIPVVLGSATPLAESVHFARSGRYRSLSLPTRIHGRPLPPISLSSPGKTTDILPPELVREIGTNLAQKEQTLVLLNRRGYAPILRCVSCGYSLTCRQCSVHLVLHKKPERTLVCHTCKDRYPAPVRCPHCGGSLLAEEGVATQKIEEWIKATFPGARLDRLDQDHPNRTPDSLAGFHRGEGDILIGTQMIAKGHDFRDVTLGIVLETDRMVSMPDYRAEERAFHLVFQLAGRVGRHREGGRVHIVTREPDLPFYRKLVRYDWEGFLDKTLADRKSMGYPPFGRIGLLTVSDLSEPRLQDVLRTVGLERTSVHGASILGPTPAPIYRARLRYRFQYLVKSPTIEGIHAVLDLAFQAMAPFKGVRLEWAVDPPDLLSL